MHEESEFLYVLFIALERRLQLLVVEPSNNKLLKQGCFILLSEVSVVRVVGIEIFLMINYAFMFFDIAWSLQNLIQRRSLAVLILLRV